MAVKFADLPVQCPILSVRRMIRKGNDIVFTEEGRYIPHRTSRRRIDFVEGEGVYFIKMKILGGVSPPDDTVNKNGCRLLPGMSDRIPEHVQVLPLLPCKTCRR